MVLYGRKVLPVPKLHATPYFLATRCLGPIDDTLILMTS